MCKIQSSSSWLRGEECFKENVFMISKNLNLSNLVYVEVSLDTYMYRQMLEVLARSIELSLHRTVRGHHVLA